MMPELARMVGVIAAFAAGNWQQATGTRLVVLRSAYSLPIRAHAGQPKAYSLIFTVTAYCPCRKCCGPHARGITASGKRVRVGMCAADWSVLPKGTHLFIPGYGPAVVEDKGGAIKGNRLDVFFPTHSAARAWGVRKLKVRFQATGDPASPLATPWQGRQP